MLLLDGRGHLVSTLDLQELHQQANRLGIGRHRFHGTRKGHPHYDVPRSKMNIVIVFGPARPVRTRTLVRYMARS